jgi:RPA family protein
VSSGPGRREVAYRLFAAEFEDAEFSYSESDEERAPNYVVTPTGARVNRLFAVGVLTEVDDVNPEMVRGRVVDPTGAFVTYAGQYQPDALAFLERADPPAFVALSGKARTFEPEDDDVVYSSVRPESVSEVDGETRDRWVVAAAERTLDRVGVMAAAVEADLAGDQLRAALVEAGVDERLADGVALALEYYDTTPAYLGAVREVALDAARVVAGDLDEVGRLDVAPGDAGGPGTPSAGDLATVDLTGAPSPATAAAAADVESAASDAGDDSVGGHGETSVATSETGAESGAGAEPTGTATSSAETGDVLGSDDGGETGSAAADAGNDDVAADESGGSEPGDFDPGDFDLDEETRAEVEEEYGTEFSTADEVETSEPGTATEPGRGDDETADPADDATEATPETDGEDGEAPADGSAADGTTDEDDADGTTDEDDADGTTGEDDADGEVDGEEADEGAADVDLEDAVMDAMESVGGGDGADREELVAAVVDEHGVEPEAVEDAIQDALMSGRCYEPSDGTLKAI